MKPTGVRRGHVLIQGPSRTFQVAFKTKNHLKSSDGVNVKTLIQSGAVRVNIKEKKTADKSLVMSSPSTHQLPLLLRRSVADRHGNVTLGPNRLSDRETLTHGHLVEPVRLLQDTNVHPSAIKAKSVAMATVPVHTFL